MRKKNKKESEKLIMKLNGAQTVCEILKEQEVDTVFAYPGGSVIDLFDELYNYKDTIKQIITAHEQGAAHAADGYARSGGKCGVVIATSGPGATNLVTGIAAAYMDSVPVVAITGNVAVSDIGKDSFQEVYTEGIFMPITKHTFVVRDIKQLADTIRQAFWIAQSGRKGPVLVDIPKNIFKLEAEFCQKSKVQCDNSCETDIGKINEAIRMINAAKRPILCYGGGVNNPYAAKQLEEFIGKTNMFFAHTLMATGLIDSEHKKNLGLLGMHGKASANSAVNEADLILAAGTRFCDRVVIAEDNFAKKAKIIQIDIDPSEINKNVKVDLSIVGDCGKILNLLCQKISRSESSEWEKQIEDLKKCDINLQTAENCFKPCGIISTVYNISGDDTIYTTDVGQHQIWAAQYIKHVKPQSFLTSGGLGAMGYGYGAAIGAKCAFKERNVIHITSDGSFLMNFNEASTAAVYGISTISIILNNRALGMVRQWQDVLCNGRHSGSVVQKDVDFLSLAKGFNIPAFRCQTQKEFENALTEALAIKNTPVWIECIIDQNENVLPMNSVNF